MTGLQDDTEQRTRSVEDGPPSRLSDDRFYRALASADRRRLLQYLLDNRTSTAEEIATVLGGWEATRTSTIHTPAERMELLIKLQHNHLPQLADAGLIEYDPQRGVVRLKTLHPSVADIIRQSVMAEASERS